MKPIASEMNVNDGKWGPPALVCDMTDLDASTRENDQSHRICIRVEKNLR